MPGPVRSAEIRVLSLSVNSSMTACATWNRLAAVQACPPLRIFAAMAPSTAASTSASSNTTNGALPPSSIEVRRSWSAALRTNSFPTGVEPVKVTFRRRGSCMSGPDSADAFDVGRIDSTPSGSPASANTSPSSSIVRGVSSAGLTMIVHPAATAGAILRVPMASGKFHGVIASTGPTGTLVTRIRPLPPGAAPNRPPTRTASSANHRRYSAP